MTKISIIIPVYNVDKYLRECLDSVVNQTLKDIEIICINDGSTDNSLQILKEYAEKDPRIILINQNNQGVSSARNNALNIAQGEYVMFVDSDDYLNLDACHLFYEKAKQTNADLVISDVTNIYRDRRIDMNYAKQIHSKEFFFLNAPESFFYISTGIIAKLFKRNILNNRLNTNLRKGEDSSFLWITCLEHNPKISILNKIVYNYIQNTNGAMHNFEYIAKQELFITIKYLISTHHFQKAPKEIQFRILDRSLQSVLAEMKFCKRNNIKIQKSYLKETNNLITLLKTLNTTSKNSIIYAKLKKEIFCAKHIKIIKFAKALFSITTQNRHKIINILGIKIKIKKLNEQDKKENVLLKKIKNEQKNTQKDSYLLFDCLHDTSIECIDAYSLFLYMREQGKKAYYVLLKDSSLYKELEKTQNFTNIIVLEKNSKSYPADFIKTIYDILLQTKAVLTSFGGNSPNIEKFFRETPYCQYIFIQHGPTFLKESVMRNGYFSPHKYNKILVSSEQETKIFHQYNWPDNKLIKVGLPRWDLLVSKNSQKEKSILIMLTWRKFNQLQFERSYYKKNLIKFLNNNNLYNLLTENNIKLYFAPHHALLTQQGINLDITSENVEFTNSHNISQYIKQCSCLITDFSSVSFDFMFQDKPVISYILDKSDPILNKNDKFDTDNMIKKQHIFPNIFFDEEFVIEKIKYYIENDFQLEPEVKKQYNEFFYTKENIRAKLVKKIDNACLENKKNYIKTN